MHAFVKYLNESRWLDNDKQNGQANLDTMQEAFNVDHRPNPNGVFLVLD